MKQNNPTSPPAPETPDERQLKEHVAVCQRLELIARCLQTEEEAFAPPPHVKAQAADLERLRLTRGHFAQYLKTVRGHAWDGFGKHLAGPAELRIWGRLQKYLDWNLVSEHVHELVQDCKVGLFEALLKTPNALEIDHLGRWASGTVSNLVKKRIERLARDKKLESLPIPGSPEDDGGAAYRELANHDASLLGLSERDLLELLEREAVHTALKACMQSLKPETRALVMMHQSELTLSQIGLAVGKHASTVWRDLQDAYALLRVKLKARGIEENPRVWL